MFFGPYGTFLSLLSLNGNELLKILLKVWPLRVINENLLFCLSCSFNEPCTQTSFTHRVPDILEAFVFAFMLINRGTLV